MSKWRFIELWFAGYGLIWAILLLVAFVGQESIDAGEFGLFGFPIIALVYAIVRWPQINGQAQDRTRMAQLERELRTLQRRVDDRQVP